MDFKNSRFSNIRLFDSRLYSSTWMFKIQDFQTWMFKIQDFQTWMFKIQDFQTPSTTSSFSDIRLYSTTKTFIFPWSVLGSQRSNIRFFCFQPKAKYENLYLAFHFHVGRLARKYQ